MLIYAGFRGDGGCVESAAGVPALSGPAGPQDGRKVKKRKTILILLYRKSYLEYTKTYDLT